VLTPFHVTPYPAWHFEESLAQQQLLAHFDVTSLEGFGLDGMDGRAAAGAVQYVAETQREDLVRLDTLRLYSTSEFMMLDPTTRRSLELTETIRSRSVEGSLLGVLDATLTPMGGRLLRRWLSQPLLDLEPRTAGRRPPGTGMPRSRSCAGRCELRHWNDGRIAAGHRLLRDLIGIRQALSAARHHALAQDIYPIRDPPSPVMTYRTAAAAIVDEPPALGSTGVSRRPPELMAFIWRCDARA
jgi:DNA mismatch repair protein MutS